MSNTSFRRQALRESANAPFYWAAFVQQQRDSLPLTRRYRFDSDMSDFLLEYLPPSSELIFYKIHGVDWPSDSDLPRYPFLSSDLRIADPTVIIEKFYNGVGGSVYMGPIRNAFPPNDNTNLREIVNAIRAHIEMQPALVDMYWQYLVWQNRLKELYERLIRWIRIEGVHRYPDLRRYIRRLQILQDQRIDEFNRRNVLASMGPRRLNSDAIVFEPPMQITDDETQLDGLEYLIYDIRKMLDLFFEALWANV